LTSNFPVVQHTFNFKCTQCADCCTGDQIVLLNLFDLYKLAGFLNLQNTVQLFEKGLLILHKENGVYRPQIRFKKLPFKFCPFLINDVNESGALKGWCRLHSSAKPLVCALSPIGLRFDVQQDHLEFLLVPPTGSCPGLKEQQVQNRDQYLKSYQKEIELQKRYFKILESCKAKEWNKTQFKQNLYGFSVTSPFEEILETLENKFLKSGS